MKAIAATFLFALSLSNLGAFAVGTQNTNSKKDNHFGLYRIENNKVVCAQMAGRATPDRQSLIIPLCSDNLEVGSQAEAILNVAQHGGERVAFASHVLAGIAGCVFGIAANYTSLLVAVVNYSTMNNPALIGVLAGGSAAAIIAVTDPTGHGLVGATGYAICGGGLTYLLWK